MDEKKLSADLGTENIPGNLPILPRFVAVIFPKIVFPLVVTEDHSVKQVGVALSKDRHHGRLV
jgi:hypothetical protein